MNPISDKDLLRARVEELLDASKKTALRWLDALMADPDSNIMEDFKETESSAVPKDFVCAAFERLAGPAGYGPDYCSPQTARKSKKRIKKYRSTMPW